MVSPGIIVERKSIADVVDRSATGDHVRQLQRLETCGLQHPFLLIEGNPMAASRCVVYEEVAAEGSFETGRERDIVRSVEDVDELCARFIVHGSIIGAIATRDAECTSRLGWIGRCALPAAKIPLPRPSAWMTSKHRQSSVEQIEKNWLRY